MERTHAAPGCASWRTPRGKEGMPENARARVCAYGRVVELPGRCRSSEPSGTPGHRGAGERRAADAQLL
eukprot:1484799-Lingulodinium_polyedra.AAC.1